MDTIIEITGSDLYSLLRELNARQKANQAPYKLRVCLDGDTAKFKINEGSWSPPLGHLDPMCGKGMRQRHSDESHGI